MLSKELKEKDIPCVRGIVIEEIRNLDDLNEVKKGEAVEVMQRFGLPMVGGYIFDVGRGIFDGKNIFGGFYTIEGFQNGDGDLELRRVKYSFDVGEQSFLGHGYIYSKPVGRLKEKRCRARFERINGKHIRWEKD